jgi:hypothetical protein
MDGIFHVSRLVVLVNEWTGGLIMVTMLSSDRGKYCCACEF